MENSVKKEHKSSNDKDDDSVEKEEKSFNDEEDSTDKEKKSSTDNVSETKNCNYYIIYLFKLFTSMSINEEKYFKGAYLFPFFI